MDSSESSEREGSPGLHKRRKLTTGARKNAIDMFSLDQEEDLDQPTESAGSVLEAVEVGEEGKEQGTLESNKQKGTRYAPVVVDDGSASSRDKKYGCNTWVDSIPDVTVEVRVPAFKHGVDYELYDGRVDRILSERRKGDRLSYKVKLKSGDVERHSFDNLLGIPGASEALDTYHSSAISVNSDSSQGTASSSTQSDMVAARRPIRSKRKRTAGFVDLADVDLSSDDFGSMRPKERRRLSLTFRKTGRQAATVSPSESDSEDGRMRKHRTATRANRTSAVRQTRANGPVNYVDQLLDDSESSEGGAMKKRRGRPRKSSIHDAPQRRSERAGRPIKSMRERLEDDIPDAYSRTSSKGAPKVLGIRENFAQLPRSDEFRCRHLNECDTCNEPGDSREKGPLVFCQGCTLAYHSNCLGHRKGRAHLVSKIGKNEFVLQCRRCIEVASKTEPSAPHQGTCQACHKTGASCSPFQARKTAKQEQEEREVNGGEDPVISVPSHLVNNPKNVLFRCTNCFQAFHFHHLPSRKELLFEADDDEEKAEKRWIEYCRDWTCHDCENAKAAVGGLVAWRPKDLDNYVYGTDVDDICEDDKEYLIKWHNRSYNQSEWMPGPWVWGITHKSMRIAFARRDDGKCLPKMRTEDAIPEDYLRVDIIFQVEYNNIVQERIEEVDLARVTEVERAQVKFKGLGYEDTVWERPPDPIQDPERWADFKAAYEDWVRGQYLRPAPNSTVSTHLRKVRALNFTEQVLLKEQPNSLSGGELMDYQLDGLNWIYYQWHRAHNAILADEMGLGKTIQVIGFMATLVEKFNCWPFLVVVPNATCANWRREIKLWAPKLRVVTYFGSAKARELSEKYELFPGDNKKELRCHIVVTSYDAAQDVSCQRILKRINWAALIVDEGQRLKSDKNILYGALSQLRTPFKLLLTGTPLQNNQRELFNLLQFLDTSKNAEELEKKYETLTKDAVTELHEMLRPFFLRRTKAQVLKFLPTMAQVIVPVSMTALQKQLYRSILGKNADLLRSIFGGERRYTSKGGLRNILMQLRKCLCHPFVYSLAIEERSSEAAVSHRRLVEASSKLQLLEIMLPKLQERGHRVLIFSQFLDMLTIVEDFMQGLSMKHIRLDGTMGSMEKQKCIDQFNAPDSDIFAFLLSTRAGGVGINLATADTVIILDPDFNPHQDIQAISRAHRIGQKKKVLIFQMMTRGSAEEKIMQIGKKKMALDHVLIEAMADEDPDNNDLEDVLRFGAEALFKDDGSSDIHYDSTSVDKLLDRSQVEDTKTGNDDSAESQFSFARIWQNDTASMGDALDAGNAEQAGNSTVWDAILAERARQAQHERELKEAHLGRGKRNRKNVDYHHQIVAGEVDDAGSANDTDFQAREESEHDQSSADGSGDETGADMVGELGSAKKKPPGGKVLSAPKQVNFQRAVVPPIPPPARIPIPTQTIVQCPACNNLHEKGSCPLKIAGVEYCSLCGLAHYGYQRTCPMLSSESAVREMLIAVNASPESQQLKDRARRSLQGLKGNIVMKKKQDAYRRAMGKDAENIDPLRRPDMPVPQTAQGPSQVHLYQQQLHRQQQALAQGQAVPGRDARYPYPLGETYTMPHSNWPLPPNPPVTSANPSNAYNSPYTNQPPQNWQARMPSQPQQYRSSTPQAHLQRQQRPQSNAGAQQNGMRTHRPSNGMVPSSGGERGPG